MLVDLLNSKKIFLLMMGCCEFFFYIITFQLCGHCGVLRFVATKDTAPDSHPTDNDNRTLLHITPKKTPIVSGLRARHFKTSASMFFFN